jgi:hypothetical protein
MEPQASPVKVALDKVIDRPASTVWQFVVTDHVRNHPRWDPAMTLEPMTQGPLALGSRIRRRHTRTGAPIEGTMDVVELDPPRAFGVVIRDETPRATLEVHSRMVLEQLDDRRTRLTVELQLPEAAASMAPAMIECSLAKIKELIEIET